MLINKNCPICHSNISLNLTPPESSTVFTQPVDDFCLLLTYFDQNQKKITYGQLYHFFCFCSITDYSWNISHIPGTRFSWFRQIITGEQIPVSLSLPKFEAETQNVTTKLFRRASFIIDSTIEERDKKLKKIQEDIEKIRTDTTSKPEINWLIRQAKLIAKWKEMLEFMQQIYPTKILPSSLVFFEHPEVRLLDMRLIRETVIVTIPFEPRYARQFLNLKSHCISLLEGAL